MDQNVFPYKTNACCCGNFGAQHQYHPKDKFSKQKASETKHSLNDSIFIGLEYRQLIGKVLNVIMPGEQFNLGLLDDDDYKVSVLRTKMLGIGECFMYRLPKGSKSPYRAEGWPLTKPLQCVSLRVERRGDVLLLIFTYTHGNAGPKSQQKLFALCPIDLVNQSDNEKKNLGHFVEAVVDSTRYFVVRVKDEKAGREALIGLGFRDREEAGDFRMALAKYESDIKRELANRR